MIAVADGSEPLHVKAKGERSLLVSGLVGPFFGGAENERKEFGEEGHLLHDSVVDRFELEARGSDGVCCGSIEIAAATDDPLNSVESVLPLSLLWIAAGDMFEKMEPTLGMENAVNLAEHGGGIRDRAEDEADHDGIEPFGIEGKIGTVT